MSQTTRLRLMSGVPVERGEGNAIHVDASRAAKSLAVSDPKYLHGRWSMGLGPMVQVLMGDRIVAHALYEPYLVISSGRLESMDGWIC